MKQHSLHGRRPAVSDTPKTDALREVVIEQYKEDDLTGNGVGNILSALTDIETLESDRDELKDQLDAAMMLIRIHQRRETWPNDPDQFTSPDHDNDSRNYR